MAITDFVRNATVGRLTVIDGSASPVSLVAAYDLGDLSITGLRGGGVGGLNDVVKFQRRGRHLSTAPGERQYPQASFTAFLTELENATAPGTLLDFLAKRRGYSGNTSTQGVGRPYSVHLKWEVLAATYGASDETVLVEHCLPLFDLSEAMDGNKLSVSVEVLGRVLVNGVVLSSEIS